MNPNTTIASSVQPPPPPPPPPPPEPEIIATATPAAPAATASDAGATQAQAPPPTAPSGPIDTLEPAPAPTLFASAPPAAQEPTRSQVTGAIGQAQQDLSAAWVDHEQNVPKNLLQGAIDWARGGDDQVKNIQRTMQKLDALQAGVQNGSIAPGDGLQQLNAIMRDYGGEASRVYGVIAGNAEFGAGAMRGLRDGSAATLGVATGNPVPVLLQSEATKIATTASARAQGVDLPNESSTLMWTESAISGALPNVQDAEVVAGAQRQAVRDAATSAVQGRFIQARVGALQQTGMSMPNAVSRATIEYATLDGGANMAGTLFGGVFDGNLSDADLANLRDQGIQSGLNILTAPVSGRLGASTTNPLGQLGVDLVTNGGQATLGTLATQGRLPTAEEYGNVVGGSLMGSLGSVQTNQQIRQNAVDGVAPRFTPDPALTVGDFAGPTPNGALQGLANRVDGARQNLAQAGQTLQDGANRALDGANQRIDGALRTLSGDPGLQLAGAGVGVDPFAASPLPGGDGLAPQAMQMTIGGPGGGAPHLDGLSPRAASTLSMNLPEGQIKRLTQTLGTEVTNQLATTFALPPENLGTFAETLGSMKKGYREKLGAAMQNPALQDSTRIVALELINQGIHPKPITDALTTHDKPDLVLGQLRNATGGVSTQAINTLLHRTGIDGTIDIANGLRGLSAHNTSAQFHTLDAFGGQLIERLATRIQTMEQNNVPAATIQAELRGVVELSQREMASDGHSIQRHGPDVTDAELTSRLQTGVAPGDVKAANRPARRSSRFADYATQNFVQQRAFDEVMNHYGINKNTPPSQVPFTVTKGYSPQVEIDWGTSVGTGQYGQGNHSTDVLVHRPDGSSSMQSAQRFTSATPLNSGQVTSTTIGLQWDDKSGEWKVKQFYPATPTLPANQASQQDKVFLQRAL
ncbi:MAG: hypothetical protein AAF772_16540 [Acidobacteriota bacterium]